MAISRKRFISATALGVSAAAAADLGATADAQARAPVHIDILMPGAFDGPAMVQILQTDGAHKQVFQSVSGIVLAPGIASVFIHMQNAMNAYEFSLGLGKLSTLAVFIGPSIVLGLSDAIWSKYGIAKNLGETGLAATNVYYTASSNLDLHAAPNDPNGIYQDWSAQAVLKRGAHFFVCYNATSAIAAMLAQKTGTPAKSVLADFEKNLLPGFQMVPAGVAAVQQAQENGWKLFPIM